MKVQDYIFAILLLIWLISAISTIVLAFTGTLIFLIPMFIMWVCLGIAHLIK